MKFYALLFMLFLPAAAWAGPDRASILLGSHHFNPKEDFQEFNPGLFLTWEGKFNVSAGVYYNSYERVGGLVALGYDFWEGEHYAVGVFGGVALYPGDGNRFDVSVGNFVPLAGLNARYRNVFVQLLPGNGNTTDGVVTFGLTFELP